MAKREYEGWPDEGYIYSKWKNTAWAAAKLDMTQQGIRDACRRGTLRGKKLGTLYRGECASIRDSVAEFIKSTKGRPRKS